MATELKGASQLRYALRKFEPDLAKELQDQMAAALKPIVKRARGYIPSTFTPSHWRGETKTGKWPIYNASLMRRGIGYKTTPSKPNRRGFSYAASIHNKTASGAIFETAGRKNPGGDPNSRSNNPGAGAHFISRMGPLYGDKQAERGRMIFRAWKEDRGKAQDAVVMAILKTIENFNQGRYGKAA